MVEKYQVAPEVDLATTQFELAMKLAEGEGIVKDEKEAVQLLLLAAEHGHVRAQFNLGLMHDCGRGVSQDKIEAAKWYRLAAEQAYALAQYNLGYMYHQGDGIRQDDTEAVQWYRLAADQGNANAQNNLGMMYENGRGICRDNIEATNLYRLATAQGLSGGQYNLGRMYGFGLGLSKNNEVAAELYRLAAEQGDDLAQFNLGAMYANGLGVPQDDVEAFKWYRLAAEQGNPSARYNLGLRYDYGAEVENDSKEAVKWYRLAAAQGHANAQHRMGSCYADGHGAPKDHEEAVKWYRLAAEQGHAKAQNSLGIAFSKGLGVAQDHLVAYALFNLSASLNTDSDSPATRNLSICSEYLNANQLEMAKSISRRMQEVGIGKAISGGWASIFLADAFSGLVGLDSVRDDIQRQASLIQIQKIRSEKGISANASPSKHLVFLGNPGTGKTTVARIIAHLYFNLGILKTDKVVETDRAGLVAAYVGNTALKTKEVIESALGGVLFIDEAYSLARSNSNDDFGTEAIETLLKMMEDYRDQLVVIVAGYESEMNAFINHNPGLASRFNRYIRFPDYTTEELLTIFTKLCREHSYDVDEEINHLLRPIFAQEIQSKMQRFSNARYVRNLFERVIETQAYRLVNSGNTSNSSLQRILPEDIDAGFQR